MCAIPVSGTPINGVADDAENQKQPTRGFDQSRRRDRDSWIARYLLKMIRGFAANQDVTHTCLRHLGNDLA